jgi:hypothetical protein
MTMSKAKAAIDALREQEVTPVAELDAIATFVEEWSARAFSFGINERP